MELPVFRSCLQLPALFVFFTKGFNWGLDFTGGVVIDTHFSQPANLDSVRTTLETNGINSAIVQTTGSTSDVMIRLPATISDAQIGDKIKNILGSLDANLQIRSVEFVGPNVGEELAQGAIYATLLTLIMLLGYVGNAFLSGALATGGILCLSP